MDATDLLGWMLAIALILLAGAWIDDDRHRPKF